jgi:hypothetical protein
MNEPYPNLPNDEPTPTTPGAAQRAWQTAKNKAGEALETGERYVREHPGYSVLSTFGLGVLVGLVVGWSMAHEQHETYTNRALKFAKGLGSKLHLD